MDYQTATKESCYIRSWDDLRKLGLNLLTGEACNMGMRLLFDMNAKAVEVMQNMLGGCVKFEPGSNWNSCAGGTPAVASVMLPPDWLTEVAAYFLIENGYNTVAVNVVGNCTMAAVGFKTSEQHTLEQFMSALGLVRGRGFRTYHTTGETRNKHAFSGRVT